MRPSVASPTGTVIGPPVSRTSCAAGEAIGRVHRHSPDAIVAEVLLDLADEHVAAGLRADPLGLLLGRGRGTRDRDRVVDLGQALGEDGLDHDALDLLDAPDVALAAGALSGRARAAGR